MKFFSIISLFLLALVPAALFAQTDFRRLEPAEAAAVLEEFRAFRMSGDACMKFTITHLLRKNDEEKHFDLMVVAAVDQMMLLYMDNNMENLNLMALEKRVKKIYKKLMEVSDEEYEEALAQQQLLEERCKWDEVDTSLG